MLSAILYALLNLILLLLFGFSYVIFNCLYRRKKINCRQKSVIITGADSGIGRDLAHKFHAKKIKVYVGCFTESGVNVWKALEDPLCVTFAIDVRDPDSIKAAIETVEENKKPGEDVWALVNNAGIAGNLCFELSSVDDYSTVMNVNFFGQIRMCEAFASLIVSSKGRIINVGSTHGRISYYAVPYTCSKLAFEHYTNGLRRKMQRLGVQVITVEPGFFSKTNLFTNTWAILQRKYEALSLDKRTEALTPKQILKAFDEIEAWWATRNLNHTYERVVEDIFHACTSVRPKMRYTVGLDAYLTKCLVSLGPDWLLDWIISFAERRVKRIKNEPNYRFIINTRDDGERDELLIAA